MHVDLPYGDSTLVAEIPGHAVILRAPPATPLDSPAEAVARALASPPAGPDLATAAAGARSATIAIPDATRPALGAVVLPPLLRALHAFGVRNVEIVIATGTHRPATAAETEMLCGGIPSSARVRSHDAVHGEHVLVGVLDSGVEVRIDAGWVRAELRIALGIVEPHLLAGFSGGAKTICPGLAAFSTVQGVHRTALARGQVGPGVVAGNPFRAEVEAAARLAGDCFAIEAVAARTRALAFVSAGTLRAATDAATEFARAHAFVESLERHDVVVTTAGGAPLDRTLYQSAKGWIAGLGIAADEADVVLVAEMRDGIGSAEFEQQLRDLAAQPASLDPVGEAPQRDAWMVQHVAQARARARLHAVCSLPAGRLSSLGIEAHASVAGAISMLVARRSRPVRVAVLPDGPFAIASAGGTLRTLEGDLVPGVAR